MCKVIGHMDDKLPSGTEEETAKFMAKWEIVNPYPPVPTQALYRYSCFSLYLLQWTCPTAWDRPFKIRIGESPKQSSLLLISPHVEFQVMAFLIDPLFALQVQQYNAPAWTGLISFFIPDPRKLTTHASCPLVVLMILSLLREPTIWAGSVTDLAKGP